LSNLYHSHENNSIGDLIMSDIKDRIDLLISNEPTTELAIYRLLEYAIAATGIGTKYYDYTEPVSFTIGNLCINSDKYYGTVTLDEFDITGNKKELMKLLKLLKKKIKNLITLLPALAVEVMQ